MYTPLNQTVFNTVYSAAYAAMNISSRPFMTPPLASYYTKIAAVAGAFAQMLDTAWGSKTPTVLELTILADAVGSIWEQIPPPSDDLRSLVPTTYSGVCYTVLAMVTSANVYWAAQGIVSEPAPLIPNTTNGDWYIDPLTGSDVNAGTALAPLATWAELNRRLGDNSVIVGQAAIAPFAHQLTTVHIINSLPASDPIDLNIILPNVGLFAIEGTATAVRTGTLSAVTALNRATNQSWEITDGVIDWTADIGKRIRITAGANVGQYGYIAENIGGGVAMVSAPLDTGSTVSDMLIPIPTPGIFSIGDAYVIETVTEISTRQIQVSSMRDSGFIPASMLAFKNLKFMTQVACDGSVLPNFTACEFTQSILTTGIHRQTFFNNCIFNTGGVAVSARTSMPMVFGGLCVSCGHVSKFEMLIDFDHLVYLSDGVCCPGALAIGTCGIYNSSQSALYVGGIFTPFTSARAWVVPGFSGLDALYGKNNVGVAVTINAGSILHYGGNGVANIPTIVGASDFNLGGVSTGRAWNEAGAAYTAAIATTWALLGTAIGAAGFGGSGHNVQLDAHILDSSSIGF
jgi:hypothetical protein